MKLIEDDLDLDGEDDFTQDKVIGEDVDTFVGGEDDYSEIEMVVAEPTKVTDVDGSIVLVAPGDVVTIKSESLKRVSLPIKEEDEKNDDGIVDSVETDEKSDKEKDKE